MYGNILILLWLHWRFVALPFYEIFASSIVFVVLFFVKFKFLFTSYFKITNTNTFSMSR